MQQRIYDWDSVAEKLKTSPSTWIKAFSDVPRSTTATARRRDVIALRPLRQSGTVEAISRNSYINDDGVERADLYMRWTPQGEVITAKRPTYRKRPSNRPKADAYTVNVPVPLAKKVKEVTSAAGVSVSAYMAELANSIIEQGTDLTHESRELKTLNFKLSPEKWEKLRDIAVENGVSTRGMIRHELEKRFGGI